MNMINSDLQKQIRENDELQKRKLEKERLADSVNMGAVNNKLRTEKFDLFSKRR